ASVSAGAALLTSSTDISVRPLVQGLSDLSMSAAGAMGGLIAGVVVSMWSFGALTALAALAAIPVVLTALGTGVM
ncbi:MAG: MFS transporter, partial [Actinomycetales bacterium]|nr:MFS transporter [Actinomycetales bacterium]